MFFLCPDCHCPSWLDPRPSLHPRCGHCGRDYGVRQLGALGATEAERYATAVELTVAEGLVLPAAYSVLLGLATLDEARLLSEQRRRKLDERGRSVTDGPALAPPAAGGPSGFRAAPRVSKRPRPRREAAGEKTPHVRPDERRSLTALLAVTAAGSLLLVWHLWSSPHHRGHTEKPRVVPASVDVETDGAGRTVRVTAPDALLVLDGFCAAAPGPGCEPIEVILAPSPAADVRLGILSYAEQPGAVYAVEIRRDGARRWVSGDGRAPIRPRPAPSLEPETPRIAVSPR